MAERPGIMVYFDLLDTLKEYTTEEAGELFLAMLAYGTTGAIPKFDDRGMRTIWKSVQQKIDRDNEKYHGTVEARQYATYCREYKRKNGEESKPLSFDDWKNQMISNDDFRIQLQPQLVTTTATSNYNRNGRGNGNGDAGGRERGGESKEAEFERKRQAALAALGYE